jgi:hypothetical protein
MPIAIAKTQNEIIFINNKNNVAAAVVSEKEVQCITRICN